MCCENALAVGQHVLSLLLEPTIAVGLMPSALCDDLEVPQFFLWYICVCLHASNLLSQVLRAQRQHSSRLETMSKGGPVLGDVEFGGMRRVGDAVDGHVGVTECFVLVKEPLVGRLLHICQDLIALKEILQ